MASESQSDSPISQQGAKPRRRFLQFSLRALLLLCSACAIGAAWIGNRAADYRRQNESRKKVEEAGGSVQAKLAWPSCVVDVVGDESWQEVSEVSFTPAGFYTAAEGLHGYQFPVVSDETLAALTAFRQLRRLRIESPDITNESLRSIGALSSLESLSLPGARLTDAGVKHLTHLKHLRSLDLSGTAMGDPALVRLASMTSLESLDLRGTRLTRTGIERLRTALPKCRVEFIEADDPLGPSP